MLSVSAAVKALPAPQQLQQAYRSSSAPPANRYRVVRGDMAAPDFGASCTDLLAQHPKDLLQWCCLVKVRRRGGRSGRPSGAPLCGCRVPQPVAVMGATPPAHCPFLPPSGCAPQGGTLVACYLRDVVSALQLHSWQTGEMVR